MTIIHSISTMQINNLLDRYSDIDRYKVIKYKKFKTELKQFADFNH